jgi:signal transduction histidine kinase
MVETISSVENLQGTSEVFDALNLVTHQVRGPLTFILGYIELHIESSPDFPKLEYLKDLFNKAKQIGNFTNDLLYEKTVKRLWRGDEKVNLNLGKLHLRGLITKDFVYGTRRNKYPVKDTVNQTNVDWLLGMEKRIIAARSPKELASLAFEVIEEKLSGCQKEFQALGSDRESVIGYQDIEAAFKRALDFMKISRVFTDKEKFRQALELKPTGWQELKRMISETASALSNIGEKIQLDFIEQNTDWEVNLDSLVTSNIIYNLLENLRNYGGAKGVLATTKEDSQIQIFLKDNGIGINPGEEEKIFARSFRGSNARKKANQGSGLGLWFCRQAIEAQGGKIWAESPGEGRGTTFYITLPL